MSVRAGLLVALLAGCAAPPAPTVALVPVAEGVDLALEGAPVTTLRYGADVRVPCLWPVRGPGGVELTRAFPLARGRAGEAEDHPHHTSLWLAHGDVNGVDFWHAPDARIELVGAPRPTHAGDGVAYEARWIAPDGAALLREVCAVHVGEAGDARWLDVDVFLEALVDVTFGDTKEGTFALRLRPELRLVGAVATGTAENSEGVAGKDVWGRRARWVHYQGEVDGEVYGVALLDHPTNPRHPTWWHARDYGLVAANPFGRRAFEGAAAPRGDLALTRGEALRLRYRVLLHRGPLAADAVEDGWRAWSGAAPR
ncbi:MAG: PmoA family protein [Planctomycetes bacterium]|nr:PmoA family protein [Planctomycetota bacterium]